MGAQNVHHERVGRVHRRGRRRRCSTGLATWVIVGHSERRRYHHETERDGRARRSRRAIEAGLRPILCVGETLEVREAGAHVAEAIVVDQVARRAAAERRATPSRRAGSSSPTSRSGRSGPGATPAAPTRPRWPSRSARAPRLARLGLGPTTLPILYGGSVTAANIDQFFAEPEIDGALVGGASLKPDEMAGIVARAGLTAAGARTGGVTADRDADAPAPGRGPIVLVVIDGFGIGARPGGRRDRRRPDARLARAARALAARGAARLRGRGGAARRARWATPRSAT